MAGAVTGTISVSGDKAGTSPIVLQNLTMFDGAGAVDASARCCTRAALRFTDDVAARSFGARPVLCCANIRLRS
jgi:hypothetical protein